MERWGFIYTLGPDAEERRVDRVGSPGCELIAVGVPVVADAAAAARWLVDDGAQLVELCGAFGPAAQSEVAAALAGAVPFGAVAYPCDQASRLHDLFG
jgi:hypothetical protein